MTKREANQNIKLHQRNRMYYTEGENMKKNKTAMASRFRRRPAHHSAGRTAVLGDAGGISAKQETAADGYSHY